MDALRLSLDDGLGLTGNSTDPDRIGGRARKVGDVDPDIVFTGMNPDGGTGNGILKSAGNRGIGTGGRAVPGGVVPGRGIDVDLDPRGLPVLEGRNGSPR